jgi:hypothetical protein
MNKVPSIEDFKSALAILSSITDEQRLKSNEAVDAIAAGKLTPLEFWTKLKELLGEGALAQAIAETKLVVSERICLLYIHTHSEGNDETQHGVFQGKIEQNDRNLLRIRETGPIWAPYEDRGANADYALLSYFVGKYPPKEWLKGDPTEWEDFIEACPFPEAVKSIEAILHAQLKRFDHIIAHGYIEDDMLEEIFTQYIDYLKKTLKANPGKLAPELEETIRNWRFKSSRDASPVRKSSQ